MNALDTFAMRVMRKRLDEWIDANVKATGAGAQKQGGMEATAMLYSEACGYIRALKDVSETLCKEVEDELRANQ